MNFKSTKMPESHKLIPNEINFKRTGENVALSNLSIWKAFIKTNLKCQLQCETKNLNYLTDHILY